MGLVFPAGKAQVCAMQAWVVLDLLHLMSPVFPHQIVAPCPASFGMNASAASLQSLPLILQLLLMQVVFHRAMHGHGRAAFLVLGKDRGRGREHYS
jgi:hypothetical protein